ncbi:MAG: hypothetical protein K0R03_2446 [Moraxellaceae bacterium]|jgi:hypothetical protein|nr:hypothetical protein [Moraxellaceae bacterium]
MRSAIALLLMVFLSGLTWADDTASAERHKLAAEYFRVSGYEELYGDSRKVEEAISSQMYTLEQSVTANMAPADAADYRRFMAEMRPDINRVIAAALERMRPQMIDAVAETYGIEELRALVAFYSSETGQKIVARTPELTNRMMAVGGREMGEMMKSMQQLVASRLQQAPKPRAAAGKGK